MPFITHHKESMAMLDFKKQVPKSEIQNRIAQLQKILMHRQIDGALILQNTDLYYFSGTIQLSHLYIPQQGDPLLMVRKHLRRAEAESAIENIIPLKSTKDVLRLIKQYGHDRPCCIGMELDVMPANLYFLYQKLFDQIIIKDISDDIRLLRSIKSAYEIDIIQHATQLSDKVAACVPDFLHEGMTELELAGLVEAEARRLGHQGILRMRMWGGEMFYGHLMAGSSAAVPSYMASPTGGIGPNPAVAQGASMVKIGRHQPVILDYAFAWRGYISDNARIFALGDLPEELMHAHHAMLEIQDAVKKAAKPGAVSGELYELAWELARALNYQDVFMGCDDQRVRFVGHGVGLEIDEYPFLAQGQSLSLKEGMVFALEPKAIIAGKGVVGIENTHVVTSEGLKQLSAFDEQIQIIES
jgi:Xaa-Pro aminopeptidase